MIKIIVCNLLFGAGLIEAGTLTGRPPLPSTYRVVFFDEFDHLSLSPTGYGDYKWYPGLPWASKLVPPALISNPVSSLQLRWTRTGQLNETTVTTVAHDLSHSAAFRYGYFEAKMAWEPVTGAWPAFWMAAIDGLKGSPKAGEIDIFEGIGSEPSMFSAALHVWDDHGKTEIFKQGKECQLPKDNNFAVWHKYGLLWTPGKMTWFYDDRPIYSADTPEIFDQQKFFLMLGSQAGVNWTYGDLRGVTAEDISLKVDWVRVWQEPAVQPLSKKP